MASVAFATYQQAAELTADDRLAAEALAPRGIDVEPAVWDALGIEWASFDLVVIRSISCSWNSRSTSRICTCRSPRMHRPVSRRRSLGERMADGASLRPEDQIRARAMT